VFRAANAGDARRHALLLRYDRMIAAKVEKEEWKRIIKDAVVCVLPLTHHVHVYLSTSPYPFTFPPEEKSHQLRPLSSSHLGQH
jgi:hypothetical protein